MTNKPEIKHKIADPYPKDVKMAFYDALFEYFNTSEVKPVDPDKNISDIIQRLRHCLGRKGYTITRAEPAAPSSDEVGRALDQTLYDFGDGEERYLIKEDDWKTLRAHIAALEAKLKSTEQALDSSNQTCQIMGHRLQMQDTDNKRLREALTKYATADVTCSYVEVSSRSYEVHEHCEKWAQAALAQTYGKAGE